MHRRFGGFGLALIAAAALSACAQPVITAAPPSTAAPPTTNTAIDAVADTAASVADALKVAPPAALAAKTTIDEKAVRIAFLTYRASVRVINGLIDSGQLVPGSATALAVKRGNDATGVALAAASRAQRAGSAPTYVAALQEARRAIAETRAALAR